ncbi:MAG: hypothetical protein IPK17_39490 [Chloroflexi bacterium]|nr:hypothetical protein [Chloroflexota bacterium]
MDAAHHKETTYAGIVIGRWRLTRTTLVQALVITTWLAGTPPAQLR